MAVKKPYSLSNVSISIGAPYVPLSGLAGDEPFVVEYDEDEVSYVAGADGNGQFVMMLNRTATGTIRTEQGSSANAVLQLIVDAGVPVPLMARDNAAIGSMFLSAGVMIKKTPALTYGKAVKELEWTFIAEKAEIRHGVAKEA